MFLQCATIASAHFPILPYLTSVALCHHRSSFSFCPSIQAEKTNRKKPNTLSFSIKTQRHSDSIIIQPTRPTLVWCRHLLSSPSFNTARDCWCVRLHHYVAACLMTACCLHKAPECVGLGEEVCAQLSVCIFSLLDHCCSAQARSDTFYLIFQFLLNFLHHTQYQLGWYLVIPVSHTHKPHSSLLN